MFPSRSFEWQLPPRATRNSSISPRKASSPGAADSYFTSPSPRSIVVLTSRLLAVPDTTETCLTSRPGWECCRIAAPREAAVPERRRTQDPVLRLLIRHHPEPVYQLQRPLELPHAKPPRRRFSHQEDRNRVRVDIPAGSVKDDARLGLPAAEFLLLLVAARPGKPVSIAHVSDLAVPGGNRLLDPFADEIEVVVVPGFDRIGDERHQMTEQPAGSRTASGSLRATPPRRTRLFASARPTPPGSLAWPRRPSARRLSGPAAPGTPPPPAT